MNIISTEISSLSIVKMIDDHLRSENYDKLLSFFNEVGLEKALSQRTINIAQAMKNNKLVIFMLTLAIENKINIKDNKPLLDIYLSIDKNSRQGNIANIKSTSFQKLIKVLLNEKSPRFLNDFNVAEHEGKLFFEIFFDNNKSKCCIFLLNNIFKNKPSPQLISDLTQSAFERQKIINSNSEYKKNINSDSAYKILLSIYHKYLNQFSQDADTHSKTLINLAIGDLYVLLKDYSTALKYYYADIERHFDINVLAAISQCLAKNNNYIESIKNMDKIIDSITSDIISNSDSYLNQRILFPITGQNSYTEEKGKLALTDLFNLTNKSNVKLFLVSGSLLGYAREGGILAHDKDCDLGIVGVDQLNILLKELSSNPLFNALPNYYKNTDTVQQPIIHLPTGTWIDIFVYHPVGDKWVTGVDIQFGYRQTFSFTPFILTKVDFFGLDIYVPDDFDLNLSENFGNWKIPDKHYISHVESPSLVEKNSLIHFLSIRLWVIRSLQYKSLGKLNKLISKLQTMKDLEGSMNNDLLNKLKTISFDNSL